MPFIGRTEGPEKYPSKCLDPKNSIAFWTYCRKPRLYFIKLHTLWQCEHCGTVFRLEKCRGMDDEVFRQWNVWKD